MGKNEENILEEAIRKRKNKKKIIIDEMEAEMIMDALDVKIRKSEDVYEIEDFVDLKNTFCHKWVTAKRVKTKKEEKKEEE